jgi:hypothetical protein
MIQAADVLNLGCNFVTAVKRMLNRRSYVAEIDVTCTYAPLKWWFLGQHEDCLTDGEICEVLSTSASNVTDSTPSPGGGSVVVTPCDVQGNLNLLTSTNSITYNVKALNTLGSVYPLATLVPNSSYITTGVNLVSYTGSSIIDTELVPGNTTPTGPAIPPQVLVGMKETGIPSDHRIVSIRLYKTDDGGVIEDIPIDIDLDPVSSPYYADGVDCSGCYTVDPAHTIVSHSNFQNAFADLMSNVATAALGYPGYIDMHATYNSGSLTVYSAVKHMPATEWFGLNRTDLKMIASDGVSSYITRTRNEYNYVVGQKAKFYNDSISLFANCGYITPVVPYQSLYPNVNSVTTNFNKIELVSPILRNSSGIDTALTFTYSPQQCDNYLLSAAYTGTGVSSVTWKNSSGVTVATTYSTTVNTPGTYTCTIVLDNGCTISKAINTTTGESLIIEES